MGVGYLALGLGRMTHAGAQLQAAADAMALHVASGMRGPTNSSSDLYNRAVRSGNDHRVEGRALNWSRVSVEVGVWLPGTRSFQATSYAVADSARVTLWYDVASKDLVPVLPGGAAQPSGNSTVTAQAVASVVREIVRVDVPARGNPWLAAQATGTFTYNFRGASNGDYAGTNAGQCSPLIVSVASLGLAAGDTLAFDVAHATLGWSEDPNTSGGPDGDMDVRVAHGSAITNTGHTYLNRFPADEPKPDNGISNTVSYMTATTGVFLTDAAPQSTAAPGILDFATAASRDFARLTPELKQPFFIGDGRASNGKRQQFAVPAGATRLALGVADCWKWHDNVGTVPVIVCRVGRPALRK